jgi:peptidoglycan/LPS O-acetylase OafA/YrhL
VGVIRVLLAGAVVFWHAPGWVGHDPYRSIVSPLPGYYAVQAFFVISGFYMELLRERYARAPIWVFYSNRYSRLVVLYWIVLGATGLLIALRPGASFPPAAFLAAFKAGSAGEWALVVFSNLTMFGQDLLSVLFSLNANALLIPQGWSLALELWFYLLVPILWRTSDRILWTIVVGSLAMRLIVVSSLPFFPWQQRFLPVEIMFFALGMLSFRRATEIRKIVGSGRLCLLIMSALIVFGGWLRPIGFPWPGPGMVWPSSILIGSVFFFSLPAMFVLTSRSRLDRLIGEFSYPIYLLHITIWYFFEPRWFLVACIAAAAPLVFLVEHPLERWRNKRLHAMTSERRAVVVGRTSES